MSGRLPPAAALVQERPTISHESVPFLVGSIAIRLDSRQIVGLFRAWNALGVPRAVRATPAREPMWCPRETARRDARWPAEPVGGAGDTLAAGGPEPDGLAVGRGADQPSAPRSARGADAGKTLSFTALLTALLTVLSPLSGLCRPKKGCSSRGRTPVMRPATHDARPSIRRPPADS